MVFIITTFITQITFLNMLIAIMGDTFDRVIDQRPTYSLKNKLMLMAAMKSMIRSRRLEDESKVFIYVIQPANRNEDEMNEDENGWRGKLYYIQSFIKTKFEKSNEIGNYALVTNAYGLVAESAPDNFKDKIMNVLGFE